MGRYVGESLASVGSQTYSDWEVIVVDDAGPEDGTRQAVADFAKRFPNHRVEYLRHSTNQGVSVARNTAIRAAKGKFLAFLDSDDMWLPEKLLKQMPALESDKDTAISYTQAWISVSAADANIASDSEITGSPPEKETALAVLGVASGKVIFAFSSLILRKEIVDQVGGFQEKLVFQNEDRIMIGSCAFFGGMTWVPESLCIYRVHDGSAMASVRKMTLNHLVDFDLSARLALWLRKQPGGRKIGSRIVKDVVRLRLAQSLKLPSWLGWREQVVDLSAQVAISYPIAGARIMLYFMRQSPAFAFAERIAKRLLHR
jgi:glycosyltransferase involved in cell wall biosynthesis